MVNLFVKIKLFLRAIKLFKNWSLFPKTYLGRLQNKTVIFETKRGIKLKIRSKSTDFMALTNIWLLEEYTKENFQIKNDDIVIDIGGHIGLFSVFAAETCKSGKIFSFEPDKENYSLLIENIKLNKFENIFPQNMAVSNKKSKITMFLNDDQSGHSTHKRTSKFITVNSITIEDIFKQNNLTKCDFLKIDAEGAEYDILEKINENILNNISKIVMEYHIFNNNYKEQLEKIITKLQNHGFQIVSKPYSERLGLIYALKKD